MTAQDSQELFLRALQAYDEQAFAKGLAALAPLLTPASRSRLVVYRNGYYARLTQSLADTVFERASMLFGRDYIMGLIGRHIAQHPPRSPVMPDAVSGLSADIAALHQAAIIDLCLARWRVLTSDDPVAGEHAANPDQLFLVSNHAWISSTQPLYSLWTCEAGEVAKRSEGVLLYKSDARTLAMVCVLPELWGFVGELSKGLPMGQALSQVNCGDANALQALIKQLAATRALVTKT